MEHLAQGRVEGAEAFAAAATRYERTGPTPKLAPPVSAQPGFAQLVNSLPLFPEPVEPAGAAGKRPIAVIGAGFSGTIAALHLLRRLPHDQPVVLCERGQEFGRGMAYATADQDHLLNVRASNMSALNDEKLHFQAWLERRATNGHLAEGLHETDAGLFASRGLYGHYLRSILDYAMRETAGRAQLRLLPDDVQDIVSAEGGGYELLCAGGQRLVVGGVVLAVGNLPPEESESPNICRNPWGEKAWRALDPDRPLLIVGTGLTMIDLAVTMRRRAFRGGIIALSRGGLLPARHEAVGAAWPTPSFTVAEATSLPLLTTRLRDEVFAAAEAGVDWRAVIDSMRPITANIWSRLPLAERQRFLRHARRMWDVHRHRMAPPHAEAIGAMLADGTLKVVAGSIVDMRDDVQSVHVRCRPRRRGIEAAASGMETTLDVQRVIMASGLEQISRTKDPLMQRLLDRGLVRMDRQGLGLDVTDGLNVLQQDGSVAERIWALGPIVRGVFWECVAVPDIRVQAAHVAVSVVARLREDAPRWSFMI